MDAGIGDQDKISGQFHGLGIKNTNNCFQLELCRALIVVGTKRLELNLAAFCTMEVHDSS